MSGPRSRKARLVCAATAPTNPCQLDPHRPAKAERRWAALAIGAAPGTSSQRASVKAEATSGPNPGHCKDHRGELNQHGWCRSDRRRRVTTVSVKCLSRLGFAAEIMAEVTAHRASAARPSIARSTEPEVKPARAGGTQRHSPATAAAVSRTCRYEPSPPAPQRALPKRHRSTWRGSQGVDVSAPPRDPGRPH